MQLLAISGSLRAASTNTALLRTLALAAKPPVTVTVWTGLADLPAFNPDHEGAKTPAPVTTFAAAVAAADGLVIACPEYVHALPGAFKNALDWLVARPELTAKPIAILHASHRGDDMLADLRRVLTTVSTRFAPEIFARFPQAKRSPDEVLAAMAEPVPAAELRHFLDRFCAHVRLSAAESSC